MKVSSHKKNTIIKFVVALIKEYKKMAIERKENLLIKLCVKILNKKLRKLGILGSSQCFKKKKIVEKDFLKRNLTNVMKIKWKLTTFSEVLKLIKQRRVMMKDKILKTPNLLISKDSENFLKIHI